VSAGKELTSYRKISEVVARRDVFPDKYACLDLPEIVSAINMTVNTAQHDLVLY